MEITTKRKSVRPQPQVTTRPDRDKDSKDRGNIRITWARGLSDQEIVGLLQMKLLESRARRVTRVGLLNELVHEIKHRFEKGLNRHESQAQE